ncbi:hypothetical protein ACFP3I_13985 [Chryseobacterium arachidis]
MDILRMFDYMTFTLAPIAMKILFAKKDCNGKRETAPNKFYLKPLII